MHEVLVNHLGGLSLPRKRLARLTDRPDMTLDVYCGRKTTINNNNNRIGCRETPLEQDFPALTEQMNRGAKGLQHTL